MGREICDQLLGEIRMLDFQMLDDGVFLEIRNLIETCTDENTLLSLRLGGRVDPAYFANESEVKTFLTVNRLDQKFLVLRRQLSFDRDRGPALPVVLGMGGVTEIFWDDLEKHEYAKSIRFFYKNKIAFQTDLDLRLISPFSVLGEGIVQYDPMRASAVFPVEKRVIHQRESYIELWEKEGAFLVFSSSHGSMYALGVQDDHLITPPEEYFTRDEGYRRTRFEITDTELQKVLRQVERDKHQWKIKRGVGYLYQLCEALKRK